MTGKTNNVRRRKSPRNSAPDLMKIIDCHFEEEDLANLIKKTWNPHLEMIRKTTLY